MARELPKIKRQTRKPPKQPAKREKSVRYAWAGFVDGKLHPWLSGFYDVEHLSIFPTKRDALRCHEDVKRVKIELI